MQLWNQTNSPYVQQPTSLSTESCEVMCWLVFFFSLWGCSLLLEISHTLCIKGSCSGAAWTLISVPCYPVGWFWLSYRDLSLTRDEIPLLEYVVWTNYFAGLLMHTPHFKIPMGYYLRWCIFHLSVLPSIVNTHSTLKNPKHFLCRL